jgi:hypothetical protein
VKPLGKCGPLTFRHARAVIFAVSAVASDAGKLALTPLSSHPEASFLLRGLPV